MTWFVGSVERVVKPNVFSSQQINSMALISSHVVQRNISNSKDFNGSRLAEKNPMLNMSPGVHISHQICYIVMYDQNEIAHITTALLCMCLMDL